MGTSYQILCNDRVIGTSDLGSRDDGMGVLLGRFTPTLDYEFVQPVFRLFAAAQRDTGPADPAMLEEYYRKRDALKLAVRTASGVVVPVDVVHIIDFMAEFGESTCDVEVYVSDRAFFERMK